MKLIFAQGNPGAEYRETRHNVGFRMLDTYAHNNELDWTEKSKFQAYVSELPHAGEKVLLVKPTTYYNDTGISARALVDFYKIGTEDVLVLHDDLMLPLGTIRTREKGSDAGNNGIKSLNSHLGQQYKRARIGIWTELADRMDATAFVLGKFTQNEQKALTALQPIITQCMDEFVRGRFESTSHK
jgi:peptidyl-tRNA hydrolase, PTH1 family